MYYIPTYPNPRQRQSILSRSINGPLLSVSSTDCNQPSSPSIVLQLWCNLYNTMLSGYYDGTVCRIGQRGTHSKKWADLCIVNRAGRQMVQPDRVLTLSGTKAEEHVSPWSWDSSVERVFNVDKCCRERPRSYVGRVGRRLSGGCWREHFFCTYGVSFHVEDKRL